MKVVVLGGYGVFGSRLVQLLVRDGHKVVVAGRSGSKAHAFLGKNDLDGIVQVLEIDRSGDLTTLWDQRPDVVVDAAGPFHGYGQEPYRVAQGCIDNGAHYLDLADDPAFCAGISTLDQAAKAAGVFVLSGASSIPAISSSVVAALSKSATEVDMISTAILPGNRAPRGRAVVESILHQCGRDMTVTLDRSQHQARSWSRPHAFALSNEVSRRAWLMDVPDNRLFPDFFGARTVQFRAGMELGIMNAALVVMSWVRAKLGLRIAPWSISALLWIAERLKPFGTDVGGMSVAVTMMQSGKWWRKTWRLLASAGEGPYIPAIASRVILRDIKAISPGARPALAEISLDAIENGLKDLCVKTAIEDIQIVPMFRSFLGNEFTTLPPLIQSAHDVPAPRRMTGRASVSRGKSGWSQLIAAVFGFPPETDHVAVSVTMTPTSQGETWERQFGTRTFRSYLQVSEGRMTERFGPFTFTLGLHVSDGALHFPVVSGRLGPLPLPHLLLPISVAKEHVTNGRFHFDVKLMAPLTGGLMVHYQGWLVGSDGA